MEPDEAHLMSRKRFVLQAGLLGAGAASAFSASRSKDETRNGNGEIHFASGCRVGEVAHDSAIIWTRLTAEPERRWNGIVPHPLTSRPREMSVSPDIPATSWEGAVPGAAGQLRVHVSTGARIRSRSEACASSVSGSPMSSVS